MIRFFARIVAFSILFFIISINKSYAQKDYFLRFSDDSLVFNTTNNSHDSIEVETIIFEENHKTKNRILEAELSFYENKKYANSDLYDKIIQSKERLFNLQLFVWVEAKIIKLSKNKINVVFVVQERWYLWPVPIFSLADRNLSAWFNKMDFARIDYGLHLVQKNFRGRNEELKANIQFGFNQKYEVFYTVPNLNKKQTLGMNIGGSFYHSRTIDYTTFNNDQLFYKSNTEYPIKKKYLTYSLVYRKNVENKYISNINVGNTSISDSVNRLNPSFFLGSNNRNYSQIEISRLINKRNTFSYPISGSFFNAGFSYKFFNNTSEKPIFIAFLKASSYWGFLFDKIHLASGIDVQLKYSDNLSFYENKALGYKSYIRGFELNVIDGQHFGVIKNSMTYPLIKKQSINLPFVNNPKFDKMPIYVLFNLFNDFGYVSDKFYNLNNPLANKFLSGTGIGVHFVSYYDRVIRIEYTINNYNKGSFFIHNTIPF